MNKFSYPAVAVIEGEGSSPFNFASSPEKPCNRIVFLEMIVGARDKKMATGANQEFIANQMASTGIANPRKQDTEDIIPQIRKVIHAASRILSVKIKNLQNYFT
jgi:hypothetical protein